MQNAIVRVPAPRETTDARTALLAFLANLHNPQTIRAYKSAAKGFWTFCARFGAEPFDADRLHAIAWRDELVKQGRAAATVTARIAACSSLYAELLREGVVARNPFEGVKRPTGRSHGARALDVDELTKLIAACRRDQTWKGARDEAVIQILFHAGLRRSELAALRVEYVERDQERCYIAVLGKGSKERRVLLHEEAADALERWLACGRCRTPGALFPSQRAGACLTANMIWRIVKSRALQANLKDVRPHGLRATFATLAFDANVPIRDVQAAMGHANPAVTGRYDRSKERGNAAVTALPRIG